MTMFWLQFIVMIVIVCYVAVVILPDLWDEI